METQDQTKATQPGHEGHGGTHLCSKCGWSYPNPHPSARHRRAHRKVCGTIEGYNLLDTTQEKTHANEDAEQCASDNDEYKTPSDKVVERTISRRSNSGTGNRSSRSTRSEDDVFTDAITDFVDGPGLEEASDGVVRRQLSLQKITEIDPVGINLATENTITDNSFATNAHVKDSQLQTIKKLERDNDKTEGGMLSHDSIPVSAAVTTENESEVEQIMEDSRASRKLNLKLDDAWEEETSSKDMSELVTPANKSEDDSRSGDVSEEALDSVSGDRNVKLAEVQIEEPDSKVNSNENMHVVALLDSLPMQEHPEIAVEYLNHKGGKFNVPMDPGTTVAFESITNSSKDLVLEETSERGGVSSHGDFLDSVHSPEDMRKQDVGQSQCVVEQNVVVGANQASDTDIGEFEGKKVIEDIESKTSEKEISSSQEQKTIALLDSVSLEAEAAILEENRVVHEVDSSPTQVDEILVESCPVKEVISARDSNVMSINVTETTGGEDESKAGTTETEPCYGSTLPESREENVEVSELGNYELQSSLHTSEGVGEVQNNAGHVRGEECIIKDSTGAAVKTEDHLDSPSNGTTSEHVAVSTLDTLVDSSSQADSLDGNWGSVSALSETKATVGRKNDNPSEIQTDQQQSPALQTQTRNNQQADKRNEEVIAKVTNWGSEKQRTPLKILLGEATERSRGESPGHDDHNSKKEEIMVTKNGLSPKRKNVVLGTEMEKEWNSPARYPVNIKTEKRRTKYWAPFLCCSSVDAAR